MGFAGTLVSIHIADPKGPMRAVPEARAVAGVGLDGDRYALRQGTFSPKHDPGREVTLIEAEAVEAAGREPGCALAPGETRRNLVTRDVPLNHLVGREFCVGAVRLRGVRLCEPCEHLERVTGKPVRLPLLHRGGLRAAILEGGTLRPGDPIRLA